MVATLNQPQYQPWPVEEQVVAIFAGINGYLDDIPTAQVSRFQDELREYLRTQGSVYEEIREQKDLSDDFQEKLTSEIENFKSSFAVKEDAGLVGAAAE
jgi:F-type H+-transporting ATPase subunit alpha